MAGEPAPVHFDPDKEKRRDIRMKGQMGGWAACARSGGVDACGSRVATGEAHPVSREDAKEGSAAQDEWSGVRAQGSAS